MGRRFKTAISEEIKDKYIEQNNLSDSAISRDWLILYAQNGLPEQYDIGYLNGKRVFFEEKGNSYKMRYLYGKEKRGKKFNLVCDGKILEDKSVINEIEYTKKIYKDNVKFFFKNKNRIFNPIEPELKKQYSIWLTDREYAYVKRLLEKMRSKR